MQTLKRKLHKPNAVGYISVISSIKREHRKTGDADRLKTSILAQRDAAGAEERGGPMITTHYKASGAGLRFALVTDLHEKNDEELVELIRKQKPDAILLAGDILERIGDCEDLAEEWQAKQMAKEAGC